MPPVTQIAIRALNEIGGPGIILKAVPGGIKALAAAAGVSQSRVSQVLRKNPLPLSWAHLIAQLIGCNEWEVYEQLGQRPLGSPYGPLFDRVAPAARVAENRQGYVADGDVVK